jgi:hypothetical protein
MKWLKIITILLFGWVNCINLSKMKPFHLINYYTRGVNNMIQANWLNLIMHS